MQPKPQIVGLPVYQPGLPIDEVKREYGLSEVVKLASNENPFGASPKAAEAIRKESESLALYPDGGGFALRQALASFYQIQPDQLIFGNGSDEIISFITRAYLDSDSNTIMAAPTFSIYKTNAKIEGAGIIEVPVKDGVHDLQAMKEQINAKTKVIWICNPDNPSGTYVSEKEIVAFLQGIPDEILVVLDEAYYEYVMAEDYPNSLSLLSQYPNLLIMRTFSKIYALASLRIGYAISSTGVIDHLNRVRGPFNANRLAQAAALAALQDQDYVKECHERNKEGLEQLKRAFEEMQLSYYPSQGNFVLVDMQRNGDEVFIELIKQGFIVRSGVSLGYPTCVRITVGSREQNEAIIRVIRKIILKGAS